MSSRHQFKKLRLIHAIASKKKPTKQAGNDENGGESANNDVDVDDANDDAICEATSPKSEAPPRSITPMELEDGRSVKSHHCNPVSMSGDPGAMLSIFATGKVN